MSKVDFQKHVRKNEGYILSEGTLNLEHLLSIAYDFIVLYNLKTSLKEDILECFEYDREVNGDLFLTDTPKEVSHFKCVKGVP